MGDPGEPNPPGSPLLRAKHIFLAVRELAPLERDEEIARLCAGDDEVRAMVERLLVGDRAPLAFESLAEDIVAARAAVAPDAPGSSEAGGSSLGTRIGRYRVLEKIGEGGFGVVYVAAQEEPIRRRVALKVIKLGMDTRQVVARFEQERQALALMDHPHIAKVHDAGATASGRPFFVMELCPGDSITEFCDKHRLTIDERLALFTQVCRAVQHAHHKGLLHRDIKPSNVLVSMVDGRPVAKVIDFGIAKAIEGKDSERTLFTEHGQFVGTPEYMSPEQAAGGGAGGGDIDTRTDIYSLGVLLYELLTGSTPFDSRSLRAAAYDEIRRIIREVDPPQPSARLSQNTDTLASVAGTRNSEPRRLSGMVRGELDWIVMKAMEKARDRRYSTAAEFVGDVERYLADEPVTARPATAMYKWRKFARRNKGLVIGVGAVAVSIVTGLAFSTVMYVRADRARVDEASQRAVAETKSATTQAINDFLIKDMLAAPNPWEGEGGRKITVAEVLDTASARVQDRFAGKPEVEASVRSTLGESYRSLGLFQEAKSHIDRAIELYGEATGEENESKDGSTAGLADALRMRAANMQSLGLSKDAEPVCRDALARATDLFGADSVKVAEVLECLADIQIGLGTFPESETTLREAIRIRNSLSHAPPPDNSVALARLTNTLGMSQRLQGNMKASEQTALEALKMFTAATGDKSAYVAQTLCDLGSLYFDMERYDESERCYARSLPLMIDLLGPEHPAVLVNRRSLANTLSFLGRDAEAEPIFREVIAASEQTLGPAHPQSMAAVNSLATMFLRSKRYAEALPLLTSLYERSDKALGPTHADTLKYAANLAWCERHLGKSADAEKHFRLAAEGFEATLGKTHPYTIDTMDSLAQFFAGEKRWAEAAKYDKLVLDRSAEAGTPEDLDTARLLSRLGVNLGRAGDYAGAKEPLRRSLELCRKGFEPGDWRTGTAEWRLGDCLSNLGEREAAEQLLLAGVKKLRESQDTPPGSLASALKSLLAHYERTSEVEKAAKVRDELSELGRPTK